MATNMVTREQVAELKAFSIALDINRGGVRDGVIPIKTAKAIKDATAAADAYLAQQQELERLRGLIAEVRTGVMVSAIVADLRRQAGELPRSLMTGEQAAASRALRAYADKLERLMPKGSEG